MAADTTNVVIVAGGHGNSGWTVAQGGPDLVLSGTSIITRLGHLDHVVCPSWEVEHKGVTSGNALGRGPVVIEAGVGRDGPSRAATHNMARRCCGHR